MEKSRRFTGRQITVMVVAASVAVIAAPVGAMAATGSLINIADPTSASHIAHVDATGHLEVGDGSGALSVDGTVATRSADQTVTLWSDQLIPQNNYRAPDLAVAKYGQVRVSFFNISGGPCTVYVESSDSVYARSRLFSTTLAAEPFTPDSSSTVFDVPGRTMHVFSDSCEVEVEVYAHP